LGVALAFAGATGAEEAEGSAQPLAQRATVPAPVIVAATGATLPSLADIVQRVAPAVVSLTVRVSAG
jgi:S1-C subfamily serine protease